jgi:uncharacterized protein YegJ (DUF2314 family)
MSTPDKKHSNLAFLCKEHASENLKAFQEQTDFDFKVGDYIKSAFVTNVKKKLIEHMWILITEIDGDLYTGTLDNDPFYGKNYARKDIVTVHKDAISAHLPGH